MKKSFLAAAVILAVAQVASARELLLPNGGFQSDAANGFGSTISSWTLSMSGTPNASFPSNQNAGLFSSFGKFTVAPEQNAFALLTNLGGTGVVTLTSGSVGNNLFLSDRQIKFNYVFLTNDAPGSFQHDQFRVHVDFFATATSTVTIGSLDSVIAGNSNSAVFSDTGAGISPFSSAANTAPTTYNNAQSAGFTFAAVDVSAFFGQFARVSFIVDSAGPTSGPNLSGLGVSGVVLDNVLLTPEPSAIALFAFGAAGLGGFAWRRRKASKKPAAA
jgi:hypothetical protein